MRARINKTRENTGRQAAGGIQKKLNAGTSVHACNAPKNRDTTVRVNNNAAYKPTGPIQHQVSGAETFHCPDKPFQLTRSDQEEIKQKNGNEIPRQPFAMSAKIAENTVVQRQIKARTPGEFLMEQESLQKDVIDNPEEYAGSLVSVGFEHEFGGFVDQKLHGVSHLTIGESSQKMPYKNLPFCLETDAGNEIELVDPPFLIETIEKGKPVPHPVDLDIANQMMEGLLYSMILNFPSLNQLVQGFRDIAGINFRVPPVKVQAENLSDKTKGDYTEDSPQISSAELLRMRLGPSQKYGGGKISTQMNFATTAGVYSEAQEYNKMDLKTDYEPLNFARDFSEKIYGGMKITSNNQQIFFKEFHKQLIAQGVVPLMDQIREAQQDEYEGGDRIRDKDNGALNKFRRAGELTSRVKDINLTWLKDSLMSFGAGILNTDDWNKVLKYTLFAQGELKKEKTKNSEVTLVRNAILSMLKEMRKQIQEIKNNPDSLYTPDNKTGFMEHNKQLLGARQDTYINPDDAQMPGIWDERLHVIEMRSDSIKAINRMIGGERLSEGKTGQIIKDTRRYDEEDKRSKATNYNLSRHAYFIRDEGCLDPLTGEITPLIGHSKMHYSKTLGMHFDPSQDLYYDDKEKAYFDQAVGAYFKPNFKVEQSYYFTKDARFSYNTDRQMYEFNEDLFFDRNKGAWFKPSDNKYTFARTDIFRNPSQDLELNPEKLAKEDTLLLKDIYNNYDMLFSSNEDIAAILKTIGEISIPYDTDQDEMIETAIRVRFGESFTLRAIYAGLDKVLSRKDEKAGMLTQVLDVKIPSETPVDMMMTIAYKGL